MVNRVNAVSTSSHKTKLARKVVYRENDKEYTIIDKDTSTNTNIITNAFTNTDTIVGYHAGGSSTTSKHWLIKIG